MKRIIYLLSLVLLAVNAAWADDISVEQALQIASRFSAIPTQGGAARAKSAKATTVEPRLAHAVKSKTSQKDNVYVINLGDNQGFVIVAGDDGADAEVLGYCDHGSFEYDKAPVQLKSLLGMYAAGVDSLRADSNRQTVARSKSSLSTATQSFPAILGDVVVGPLLTTRWNQLAPYNNLCPEGCPTGCVPTAIAQVMNYWQWPKQGYGQYKTYDEEGNEVMLDFPIHIYDWDNMLDDYSGAYTSEQATAVAQLMADIGKAFGTNYKLNGSPTAFYFAGMYENFHYSPAIGRKFGKTSAEITNDMKRELDAHRPVLYSGNPVDFDPDENPGHALVVDGYTTKNYFHFNYGWGGESDGWFYNGLCDKYYLNCEIWTDVFPYEGEIVMIDGIRYGLMPNGTAEVIGCDAKKWDEKGSVLYIPASVKDTDGKEYDVVRIKANVFVSGYDFKEVIIGDNVKEIEAMAFTASRIEKLVLGNSVETIGEKAFWSCDIKELTIGSAPLHIGKEAFTTCNFNSVISKSSAIDVDENAFRVCGFKGDFSWVRSVRSAGRMAFAGADFSGGDVVFEQLESAADSAFYALNADGKVTFGPRLRHLSVSAVQTLNIYRIYIDEANPYYSCDNWGNIYTKDFTTLVCYNPATIDAFDARALCIAEGAIPPLYLENKNNKKSIYIPRYMQDVRGAFRNCNMAHHIYCHATVPPEANDETFNDHLFDTNVWLNVPAGCREAYENAPGWRRFRGLIYEESNPWYTELEETLPPVEREYYMVAHSRDLEGGSMKIPVSEVKDISVTEEDGVQQMRLRYSTGSDIVCDILNVDSISWQPGFIYGTDHVSEVGEDKLEAYGRTSKIRFDATVFNEDTQVSIRESVLAPTSIPGAVSGNIVSIELANGEHQLNGTATISIDLPCDDKHIPTAAYFNQETGKWEPIAYIYNKETQQMEIHTSHLSEFGAFIIDLEYSVKANFKPMYETIAPYGIYDFYETVANVESLCLNPENQAVFDQFKDDESLWQQLLIDGGYTTASAFLGESPLMEELKGFVGDFGTIISVVDLLHADYTGDRQAVLDKSLGIVLGQAQNLAGTLFGTPVLTASMGIVGLVGVALNKFGTMVQESRMDLFRRAMRIYYSKEKSANNHYRGAYEWYKIMLPVFREPKTQKELNDTIDKIVCDYCYSVWKMENYDDWNECLSEAMREGWKADGGLNSAVQDKLSQEMRSQLYNGVLIPAFEGVFRKITEESENHALAVQSRYVEFMNRPIIIRFKDSSCSKGERSRYAGMKLRMVGAPETGDEAEEWITTVGEDGSCVFQLSTIAYINNRLPGQFALQKSNGEELTAYNFKLPEAPGAKKLIISIDLATQNILPETPQIKGIEMEFSPSVLRFPTSYYWESISQMSGSTITHYNEFELFTRLVANADTIGTSRITYHSGDPVDDENPPVPFMFNVEFKHNPHSGLLQYFAMHSDIRIDPELGQVYIGNDIVGNYNAVDGTGEGKFKIHSIYPFVDYTVEEFNSITFYTSHPDYKLNPWILSAEMKYDFEGTFRVTYKPDADAYEVVFEADGTYCFTATWPKQVTIESNYVQYLDVPQRRVIDELTTGDQQGKVKLKCTRMLQTVEQEMNNQ